MATSRVRGAASAAPAPGWQNVTQMIASWGYPVEDHWAQTSDGFLLSLQRIPHGKSASRFSASSPRPVALLQHGLLDSSSTWVINPPQESLGYILADAGFDVWLCNSRGNMYSQQNVNYNIDTNEFWNLVDFDYMAEIDLPTAVDYVLQASGRESLVYIGHSEGTTIGFAAFPENSALAAKIDVFIALAPAAWVHNVNSALLDFLAASDFAWILKFLGEKEFLPDDWITKLAAKTLCVVDPTLCEDIIFLLCGWDPANTNLTRMPTYISHTPAGTSVRNMLHWSQEVSSNFFRKYDYGSAALNMQYYNSSTPPNYRPQDMVKPPVAIFTGTKDILADPTDVQHLLSVLPAGQPIFNKNIDIYQHLDFVWAENAYQTIYPDVIRLAKQYSKV